MVIKNEEQIRIMHRMDDSFREIRTLINTEWSKEDTLKLGPTHGRMLTLLSDHGAMKASSIAEKLFITCGAVTGLSDRLIELGFIQREKDETDRRVVLLTLTDQGEENVVKIRQVRKRIMLKLFGELSMEEMQSGLELFEKIRGNLVSTNVVADE